ncbi:hypothetical protein BO99DRAFT_52372 [Aspergillus violaceofuscus CBS 115571]|uniref:Uncharacterized protein n=1 Tax=Aspergillus violaceofuscus (strain CBS 115571) TaxID=1450538 RepID=A0A2V5HKA0_ASPV1|nr:hypothetical protein BO99DRAFT_52372 [Aspergillus violaceofuscus CBS 115571]
MLAGAGWLAYLLTLGYLLLPACLLPFSFNLLVLALALAHTLTHLSWVRRLSYSRFHPGPPLPLSFSTLSLSFSFFTLPPPIPFTPILPILLSHLIGPLSPKTISTIPSLDLLLSKWYPPEL